MVVGETPEKRQNQRTSLLHASTTGVQKPATHLIMDDKRVVTAEKADGQRKQPEFRLAGNCISDQEIQLLYHLFSQAFFAVAIIKLLIKMFHIV